MDCHHVRRIVRQRPATGDHHFSADQDRSARIPQNRVLQHTAGQGAGGTGTPPAGRGRAVRFHHARSSIVISETLIELSRLQFALTAMYHFLFVPLTLGLSFLLAIMESVYVMTGKPVFSAMPPLPQLQLRSLREQWQREPSLLVICFTHFS